MPKVEVHCTVSDCDYWGHQNHCVASQILITTDEAANAWPDSIDSPQASTLQQTPAGTCAKTACKTFRPRGSKAGPNLF